MFLYEYYTIANRTIFKVVELDSILFVLAHLPFLPSNELGMLQSISFENVSWFK